MQKRGGNLCKKLTAEEAKAFLLNHLKVSPYHQLEDVEAQAQVDLADVTSWEESLDTYQKSKEDEKDWAMSRRKRGAGRGGGSSSQDRPEQYRMPPLPSALHGMGSDGGVQMVPLRADRVMISKEELKNISDSLRRAKTACEAAHQLCGKASRAFAEEAQTIGQCKEVVDSHLPFQ